MSFYKDTKFEYYAKRICVCFRRIVTRMKNRRIAVYERQIAAKTKKQTSIRDLRFQLFSEFGPNKGKNISELYNELTLKRGWQEEDAGPKYLTWKRILARMINRW